MSKKIKRFCLVSGITGLMLCLVLVYAFANKSKTDELNLKGVENIIKPTESVSKDKILIAYFTSPETDGVDAVAGASRAIVDGKLYGNTEYMAKVIQEATGGNLFEIKTTHTYPGTHKELIDFAKVESNTKARPKLATHISNLGQYDVIFIGFPNWWYDMPQVMYTFFEEYDFDGKTIVPFCTHGGSRFSSAIKTITDLEKNAKVVKGLPVSRDNVSKSKDTILKWLQDIGMMKK